MDKGWRRPEGKELEDLERAQVEQAPMYSHKSFSIVGKRKDDRVRPGSCGCQRGRRLWMNAYQVMTSDLKEEGTNRVPTGQGTWLVSSHWDRGFDIRFFKDCSPFSFSRIRFHMGFGRDFYTGSPLPDSNLYLIRAEDQQGDTGLGPPCGHNVRQ